MNVAELKIPSGNLVGALRKLNFIIMDSFTLPLQITDINPHRQIYINRLWSDNRT